MSRPRTPSPLFTEEQEVTVAQLEAMLTFITSSNSPPTPASVKLATALADRLAELLTREIIHGRGGSLYSMHLRDGLEMARLTVHHHGIVLTMPTELRQTMVGQAST